MPSVQPPPSWRTSWSPSEMHLQPAAAVASDKDDSRDLPRADENPLSYFLSPALQYEDYDEDDYSMDDYDDESDGFMDFELDAGIEDASRPMPDVRSVSPSSLGHMTLPRPPTPPRRGGARDNDSDDDDDTVFCLQLDDDVVPYSFPSGSLPAVVRGRSRTLKRRGQPHHGGAAAAYRLALRDRQSWPSWQGWPTTERRSPRSWQMPSPDVFCIEEETEQELAGVDGNIAGADTGFGFADYAADLPAGTAGLVARKPKKHVRFVLPDNEVV